MPDALERLPSLFTLPPQQKVYFASDFHLGSPDWQSSRVREEKIIRWLDNICQDAYAVFLLGDTFDFWFEYRHVVPKGNVRLLGKLADMVDQGVLLFLFTGNHDVWMFDYFPQELGIPVITHPISIQINHQHFYIGTATDWGRATGRIRLSKRSLLPRWPSACSR